jgi:hypothetical protein
VRDRVRESGGPLDAARIVPSVVSRSTGVSCAVRAPASTADWRRIPGSNKEVRDKGRRRPEWTRSSSVLLN